MIQLLFNGQVQTFIIILAAIIFSLTLHEYGHAKSAQMLGDDTAERMGRLTLNPMAHIDIMGLLMVVVIGFGWAKPVPMNPRNFRKPWASAASAAAGPLMNLLLAVAAVNLYVWAAKTGAFELSGSRAFALSLVAQINLLLMLFNLMPIGPLDGHHIMSWLLPPNLGKQYDYYNSRHGSQLFMILVLLSFMGVPIFRYLMSFSASIIPYITFI